MRLKRCMTELDTAAVMCGFGLPQALLSRYCMYSEKREDMSCDCLPGQVHSSQSLVMRPLIGCTAFSNFSIWTVREACDWRVMRCSLLRESPPASVKLSASVNSDKLLFSLYCFLACCSREVAAARGRTCPAYADNYGKPEM